MLTNFKTIQSRIRRLKEIEAMQEDGTFDVLPKKEVIELKKRTVQASRRTWAESKEMKKGSGCNLHRRSEKERICVQEAHTLGIPLIGICDTNCDPEELDYVIPGNDDAIRAVKTDCCKNGGRCYPKQNRVKPARKNSQKKRKQQQSNKYDKSIRRKS